MNPNKDHFTTLTFSNCGDTKKWTLLECKVHFNSKKEALSYLDLLFSETSKESS